MVCHTSPRRKYQGDSRFLMVGSQIGILTPDPSFGHNLCFKYPNGSFKLILNIYVQRAFQWYKELFNPMNFDPYNRLLKIRKSIRTLAPKVGARLKVCGFIPSHSPTLPKTSNVTPRLHSWTAPLQALGHKPKARVTTLVHCVQNLGRWD